MKVNTDDISEKYRKYIVKLVLSSGRQVYILWGTNLENEDVDYILVNKSDKILAFSSIAGLINYVSHANVLIDRDTTRQWAENYIANQLYNVCDLYKIKNVLNELSFMKEIGRDDAIDMVACLELITDYAHQINSSFVFDQLEKKDMKIFHDYVYEGFLWDGKGEVEKIKEITDFNFENFRNDYTQLVRFFEAALMYP